jgi:hypothetical protein
MIGAARMTAAFDVPMPAAQTRAVATASTVFARARDLLGSRAGAPAELVTRSSAPPSRPLDRLVALQRAEGSWRLTADLARAVGFDDVGRLRKALGRELAGDREERAAGTALALAWLERECADTRDEWRMLAAKAREWLEGMPGGAGAWLSLAEAALDRR